MDLFDELKELESFESKLINFKKQKEEEESNKPSELKISIMSATAAFNTIINLKALSKYLKLTDNICHIDSMFNMTRKVSNISKKKIFYNQLTIKIRPYYNKNYKINLNLIINLKLFRNGKIQMCGLRSENDGYLSLKILLNELNKINKIQQEHINIFSKYLNTNIVKTLVDKLYNRDIYLIDYDTYKNINNINIINNLYICKKLQNENRIHLFDKIKNKNSEIINIVKYNITLINSDFSIGFKINRTIIYDYILNDCGLLCDFDPCIYQGVLIKFYWNYNKEIQNGKCMCSIPCSGKGKGNGNGECRKITISIFQSGNIIITGKCIRSEINYIYNYIIELLYKNIDDIKQISFIEEEKKIKRRNISILIKK